MTQGMTFPAHKAWVLGTFLKPNLPHMTQSGEGMAPQRENEVLVPEEGQMLAWPTKTTGIHCGLLLKWVSLLPY